MYARASLCFSVTFFFPRHFLFVDFNKYILNNKWYRPLNYNQTTTTRSSQFKKKQEITKEKILQTNKLHTIDKLLFATRYTFNTVFFFILCNAKTKRYTGTHIHTHILNPHNHHEDSEFARIRCNCCDEREQIWMKERKYKKKQCKKQVKIKRELNIDLLAHNNLQWLPVYFRAVFFFSFNSLFSWTGNLFSSSLVHLILLKREIIE